MNDSQFPAEMQELLPISENAQMGGVVSARALHEALSVGRDFSAWIKQRINECQAVENQDFCVVDASPNLATGELEYNNRRIEYAVTLDFAKHIAMLQRNDLGHRVRSYFIAAEKRARGILPFNLSDPETVLEYALEQARTAKAARLELEAAAPKVEAFERLMDATGTYSLSQVAKMLGTGVVRLCSALRDAGVLMHDQPNWNVAYQRHVDAGRFEVKPNTVLINGEPRRTYTTRVTTKGLEFIRRLLEKERVA
jgi:anti-repressor protein